MTDIAEHPRERVYRIQDCPPRHIRGGRDSRGQQILVTIDLRVLIAIFFDDAGYYLGVSTSDLERPQDMKPPFDHWAGSALRDYMERTGYRPSDIAVRKFAISVRDRDIGIEDMPAFYARAQESEERMRRTFGTREEFELDRADWERSGNFVLKLPNEYGMDEDGSVNST